MSEQDVKVKGVADVVFLVDCTGSMEPCLEGLKSRIAELATSLSGGNYASVVWRAKVVGYRDFEFDHEPLIGQNNPWTSDSAGLQSQISLLRHEGGADAEESALDAIQLATKMDWKKLGEAHRVIVLLTDAPTKSQTKDGMSVMEVANELSSEHLKILLYGPSCNEYEILGRVPKCTFTDVSKSGDVYEGLKNLDWRDFLETIAKTVSQPQVAFAETNPSSEASNIPEASGFDPAMPLPPPDGSEPSGGKTMPA